MQDGIIAGNGNSRYLKTVAAALSLYPTYQDFMAALIAGTFPIDLNGINSSGWVQQGTSLNKATLLSDQALSALGLSRDKVPSDAFIHLKTLLASAEKSLAKVEVRSYVGTGTYGESNPCSLTFSFVPEIVLAVFSLQHTNQYYNFWGQDNNGCTPIMMPSVLSTSYGIRGTGFSSAGIIGHGKMDSSGKSISWYVESDRYSGGTQLNYAGYTYYFVGIGK